MNPVQYPNKLYCRFCAENLVSCKEKLIDLSNPQVLEHYKNIFSVISIKFIDLDDGRLPKTVCNPCSYSIKRCFTFFEKAKKAQEVLSGIFGIKDETDSNTGDVFAQDIKIEVDNDYEVDNVASCSDTSQFDTTRFDVLKNEAIEAEKVEVTPIIFKEISDNECILENYKNIDQESDSEAETEQPTSKKLRKSTRKRSKNENTIQEKKKLCYEKSIEKEEEFDDSTDLSSNYSDDNDSASDSENPGQSTTNTKKRKTRKGNKNIKERVSNLEHSTDYDSENEEYSWTDYKWHCCHCKERLKNMDELRDHSKAVHNVCFSFKCNDCDDDFNIFGNFIEHVRVHRHSLRKHCYICNKKFSDTKSCESHEIEHWLKNPMCGFCGETFSDDVSFQRHKAAFKRKVLLRSFTRKNRHVKKVEYDVTKSWKDYDWICTYCYMKAPSLDALRKHSREVHKECFTIKCADCFKVSTHFKTFVSHVQQHRPHLLRYCQICNRYDETQMDHVTSHKKYCLSCGQSFTEDEQLFNHLKEFNSRLSYSTPQEDLVCKICNKTFTKSHLLKSHLNVHKDRVKDHTCDECGASFFTRSSLESHKYVHNGVDHTCLICKKVIKHPHRFRIHVKAHFESRNFSCHECGRSFMTKQNLKMHMQIHSDAADFKCEHCEKAFKRKGGLKRHMVQHTGDKPYPCKYCEKSFGNWGNCNKHMLLKHKVSLAKTKRTPKGTVMLDKTTGQPVPMTSSDDVKEWVDQVLEKKHGGGRKKKSNL